MTEHLVHEHSQKPLATNMCNRTRKKTVLTRIGSVVIEVLRDR